MLGSQRDLEGALQSLEEALRLDPSHARARGYRGVLLYEMGRQGEARPDLMAAAEQGITDGAIHFALARSLAAAGELSAALTAADQAADDQPQNWAFQFVRARILSDLERYDESLEALRVTVRCDPSQEEPWIVLCTIW